MDTQVADLLGGERVLGASVKSNLDLARATRQGLPAETAVQLGDAIGLTAMGPLGALIGSLRPKVDRKGAGEAKANASPARLTPEQSDVVIRTARTLAKAIDTLGDREKAAHWLTTPNRALGGEIPITLLDTSSGSHEVEAVLDRIEYGVYS
jgi:putative toxin-antitoxin system antitoxin component (TIGR02293 family)